MYRNIYNLHASEFGFKNVQLLLNSKSYNVLRYYNFSRNPKFYD